MKCRNHLFSIYRAHGISFYGMGEQASNCKHLLNISRLCILNELLRPLSIAWLLVLAGNICPFENLHSADNGIS